MNDEIKKELQAIDTLWLNLEPLSLEAKQRALAWLTARVQQEQADAWKNEKASFMLGKADGGL